MEENNVHRLLYIAGLIYRQRSGELDAAEEEVLATWLAASEENRQLFRELNREDLAATTREETDESRLAASIDRVYQATGIQPKPATRRFSMPRIGRWAAAVLFLIISGAACLVFMKKEKAPMSRHSHDVSPGGRKAILKLGNGSTIILDDAQNGVIASQGKTLIKKSASGQLVYDASNAAATTEITYNTITTPNGGEYQVILPDGSRVWLNAASSIRFPAAFTGNTRSVDITGEAYFEVTRNARSPFIVNAGKQTVEVLGTQFNVQSYQKEENAATTLVQGSVRVTAGATAKVLQPGQQWLLNRNGATRLKQAEDVDIDEVLAWRNGKFIFNDTDLKTVVNQLERWYDVKIDCTDMPEYRFNGEISRNVALSKVLKMMELTSNIHYKITDRNIYLTK